eukprot:916647-Rhodomonas_salina.4
MRLCASAEETERDLAELDETEGADAEHCQTHACPDRHPDELSRVRFKRADSLRHQHMPHDALSPLTSSWSSSSAFRSNQKPRSFDLQSDTCRDRLGSGIRGLSHELQEDRSRASREEADPEEKERDVREHPGLKHEREPELRRKRADL